MLTTGVVGGRWRATVTEWGAIEPWDGSPPLDWYVAADDRWHVPRQENTVRQSRLDGTAVAETRVRVPGGDAVQRVWTVPDAGGLTLVEIVNESHLPLAVAFTGPRLLSWRPPSSVGAQGIDLPTGTVVHPVGHHASVVVALSHLPNTTLPGYVPSADQVARGWVTQTERASRLRLPDRALVEAVTAARCELMLSGPADDDPVAVLLGAVELVRLGDNPTIWVPRVAEELERVALTGTQIPDGVVDAVARLLHAAGEDRAVRDLRKLKVAIAPAVTDPPAPALVPAWVERMLVTSDDVCATLVPSGFPRSWVGVDFEAHGLPVGMASHVSFAIRWHGSRPAVLWELSGPPMTLRHGDWTSAQLSGEALWSPPTN